MNRIHELCVRVMVLNAIFNNISVYRGGQFYWYMKPEYPEKISDLPQVTDKIYHIMLYPVKPRHERGSNSQLQW